MIPLLFAAAVPTLSAMRDHRRVLVVSAPSATDPGLTEQRRQLGGWRSGADDRDLTTVEVIGDRVTGVGDPAVALRTRLHLPPGRFAVALIGKDGHVAERSDRPLTGAALQATIDAMPMRRAGQR